MHSPLPVARLSHFSISMMFSVCCSSHMYITQCCLWAFLGLWLFSDSMKPIIDCFLLFLITVSHKVTSIISRFGKLLLGKEKVQVVFFMHIVSQGQIYFQHPQYPRNYLVSSNSSNDCYPLKTPKLLLMSFHR